MDTIIALQRLASPALDRVMLLVTDICSQEAFTVLLVLAFLAVDATFGRRLGIVFLTGAYLNDVIKTLVDAPRPFQTRPDVLRPGAADTAPGSSFPSGHTQSAAIFWTLAASQFKRAWFWLLAAPIVAAVALSRVYLGVHYPRDILGGLAVGLLVVTVAQFARRLAFTPGKAAVVALGLLVPLVVHLLFTTEASHVFLAVASAFIVGPELVTHRAGGALSHASPWASWGGARGGSARRHLVPHARGAEARAVAGLPALPRHRPHRHRPRAPRVPLGAVERRTGRRDRRRQARLTCRQDAPSRPRRARPTRGACA